MYTDSDRRLKYNIKPIDNALQRILKSEGVFYTKKADPTSKIEIGVIAQDLLKSIPEVVIGSYEDAFAVNYAAIVPILIEAVKEQQKLIEKLYERFKDI